MLKQCFANVVIDFSEGLEPIFLLFCQSPPDICSFCEHVGVEGSFQMNLLMSSWKLHLKYTLVNRRKI